MILRHETQLLPEDLKVKSNDMMQATVIIMITVWHYWFSFCSGTATIEIQLVSFNNTASRLYNDDFCEELKLSGDCSHYFKFCISNVEQSSEDMVYSACDCDLFQQNTGTLFVTNYTKEELREFALVALYGLLNGSITLPPFTNGTRDPDSNKNIVNIFGEDIAGMANPIILTHIEWDGTITFGLSVWEWDVISNHYLGSDQVDNIHETISMHPALNKGLSVWQSFIFYGNRPSMPSSLEVMVRAYCDVNFTGPYCGCQSERCLEHYECDDTVGRVCLPGWEDPMNGCMTPKDYCIPDPCQNVNTCMNDNQSYICICGPGYTGDHCETDIDECASSPCQNNANCIDGVNNFTCNCPAGYVGANCVHVACTTDDQCINGKCQTGTCHCNPGYGDPVCGTSLCHVVSCLNGGVCHDGQCTCAVGYTGSVCEFRLCDFSSCLNDGTCARETGRCHCLVDYTGEYCENTIGSCSVDCGRHGQCHNGRCTCHSRYFGKYCEHSVKDWRVQSIIMVCCATVGLALIITCLILASKVDNNHKSGSGSGHAAICIKEEDESSV